MRLLFRVTACRWTGTYRYVNINIKHSQETNGLRMRQHNRPTQLWRIRANIARGGPPRRRNTAEMVRVRCVFHRTLISRPIKIGPFSLHDTFIAITPRFIVVTAMAIVDPNIKKCIGKNIEKQTDRQTDRQTRLFLFCPCWSVICLK